MFEQATEEAGDRDRLAHGRLKRGEPGFRFVDQWCDLPRLSVRPEAIRPGQRARSAATLIVGTPYRTRWRIDLPSRISAWIPSWCRPSTGLAMRPQLRSNARRFLRSLLAGM